jgi:hypothetical protein
MADVPTYIRTASLNRAMVTIRVEQGRDGKEIEIEALRDVVANLMWFYELDGWGKAAHLAVTA